MAAKATARAAARTPVWAWKLPAAAVGTATGRVVEDVTTWTDVCWVGWTVTTVVGGAVAVGPTLVVELETDQCVDKNEGVVEVEVEVVEVVDVVELMGTTTEVVGATYVVGATDVVLGATDEVTGSTTTLDGGDDLAGQLGTVGLHWVMVRVRVVVDVCVVVVVALKSCAAATAAKRVMSPAECILNDCRGLAGIARWC